MKFIYISAFLFLNSFGVLAAQTLKDIATPDGPPIVWLGVDFSHLKFIGQASQFNGAGDVNAGELKNVYFRSWNNVIITERDKYNFRAALRRPVVDFDLAMINALNETVDPNTIFSYASYNDSRITKEMLAEFVANYNTTVLEKKTGIGMVFIADAFDKTTEMATAYIVFFTLDSKRLIHCEKLAAAPSGFGVRNYWAGALYRMIVQIRDERFYAWK